MARKRGQLLCRNINLCRYREMTALTSPSILSILCFMHPFFCTASAEVHILSVVFVKLRIVQSFTMHSQIYDMVQIWFSTTWFLKTHQKVKRFVLFVQRHICCAGHDMANIQVFVHLQIVRPLYCI